MCSGHLSCNSSKLTPIRSILLCGLLCISTIPVTISTAQSAKLELRATSAPRLAASKNSSTKRKVEYAIVLHGGAGSSPVQFPPERNAARRKSLAAALKAGQEVLAKGGTSLDAVESVIRVMENDPIFNAGKGAVYNSKGQFELDASIMDGKNRACGAVAGVSIVKNPISLARLVMTKTKHVMLSSDGADQFAKQMQVELVPNIYFQTPASKAKWERQQSRKKTPSQSAGVQRPSYFGTVGCVALDKHGNIAAGTSTGGLSNKKYGRVGDSPVIGAGTYADNDSCGVSCTGIGEHFIRNSVAFDVSARMKYKKLSVAESTKEVIHSVLKKNYGGLIALDRQGNIAIDYNTRGMSSAAADSNGRFEINWGKKK